MNETISFTKLSHNPNTKEKIIKILSEKWPRTVKEIFNTLKKDFDTEISYQATHKVVDLLFKEQVIVKNSDGYLLNIAWIKKQKNYSNELEKKYLTNEPQSASELCKKEFFQVEFDTPMMMGRFLLDFFEECQNSENKPTIFFWYHAWPIIAFSDQELKRLKNFIQKTPYYILSAFTTPIDNITLSALKDFGAKIAVETYRSFDPEQIVIGDYVLNFYFDYAQKIAWHELCMKTKEFKQFNLLEMINKVSEQQFKVIVTGTRHIQSAKELRKQLQKYFEE